jgi:ABC-type transport system substrate-binding protein
MDELQKAKDIQIHSNEKSALYYLGFNVRKPPLDDVFFRQAIATLIDKDFLLSRLLQGHGVKMDAMVPPGNRYWHCTNVNTYGDGLSRNERIKKAYAILKTAGYQWELPPVNDSGEVVNGKGIKEPSGSPVPTIEILTPPADYDPMRAQAGIFIQEWLRAVGIPVRAKPIAASSLSEQIQVRRDFDAFIHGYGNLSLDPDYVRSFFHSREDRIRGRNTSGYHNPEFDRISDESAVSMDKEKRRQLICKMQQIISRDVPWIPLYDPNTIEAVRTDRFTGWIDMPFGIGNWWSFCLLKPIPPFINP